MAASELAAKTSQLGPCAPRFGNSTTAPATILCPGHLEAVSDATRRVWIAPFAGTCRAMYAHTSAAHGVGAETVSLTVALAGAPTTMVTAFTSALTDVSDTAHTFTFAAGQAISIDVANAGGVAAVLLNVSVTLACTLG